MKEKLLVLAIFLFGALEGTSTPTSTGLKPTSTNILPTKGQSTPSSPSGQHTLTQPHPPAGPSHLLPQTMEAPPLSLNTVYTSPGIASLRGGDWVGSEDLYNLTNNIGVHVELVAPKGLSVISEAALFEKVSEILKTVGLHPSLAMTGANPLPFFHVLIMLQPIDRGYVAYCAGRLFERIDLPRVHLKTGVIWQAITWEKQEIIVSSQEQIQMELMQTISNITTTFAETYKAHKTGGDQK